MVMIEYFFRFKIQLHSHAGWLVGGHSQLQKSSDLHYRKNRIVVLSCTTHTSLTTSILLSNSWRWLKMQSCFSFFKTTSCTCMLNPCPNNEHLADDNHRFFRYWRNEACSDHEKINSLYSPTSYSMCIISFLYNFSQHWKNPDQHCATGRRSIFLCWCVPLSDGFSCFVTGCMTWF